MPGAVRMLKIRGASGILVVINEAVRKGSTKILCGLSAARGRVSAKLPIRAAKAAVTEPADICRNNVVRIGTAHLSFLYNPTNNTTR